MTLKNKSDLRVWGIYKGQGKFAEALFQSHRRFAMENTRPDRMAEGIMWEVDVTVTVTKGKRRDREEKQFDVPRGCNGNLYRQ